MKFSSPYLTRLFITGAAALFATSALAVPVTLTGVDAEWTGVSGGNNVSHWDTDGNGSMDEIRWGYAIESYEHIQWLNSGYRFRNDDDLPASFESGEIFTLGTFTHFNKAIPEGSSISGAELTFSTELDIIGTNLSDGPYTFSFQHNETLNSGCEPGDIVCLILEWICGPELVDDIVILENPVASREFQVGSYLFSMEILGFEGITSETFQIETEEWSKNSADILARLNVTEIAQVPEPGTLGLIGLALAGLGLSRRTRR